jgi:threonyl-tRNA synthetase
VVLPISDRTLEYADGVLRQLREAGLRAECDRRGEKIGAKIRDAQLKKIPFMLVVGEREAKSGAVAVRSRREGDLGPMSLEEIRDRMRAMQSDRSLGP